MKERRNAWHRAQNDDITALSIHLRPLSHSECVTSLLLLCFQMTKSRLLFTGSVGSRHLALVHLKLTSSQGSELSPSGSSSGNLCLDPASKTSSPVLDSGQRLSLPSRTACAFSFHTCCFSSLCCNPFSLRHTCKFSEPPPSPPQHTHTHTCSAGSRRELAGFCFPLSVFPEC